MTLDELRASRPALGFALYAYTPGGAVTLEVHDNGEIYSFVGATEAEAIARAFPPSFDVSTGEASRPPASAASPPQVAVGTSEESVFD